MFERYTDRARRAVTLAQDEARQAGDNAINTTHMLLGVFRCGGAATEILTELGFDFDATQKAARVGEPGASVGHIPFTPRAKKALELSLREALTLGHNYIGSEHLLLGICREGSAADFGFDIVRQAVNRRLGMLHTATTESSSSGSTWTMTTTSNLQLRVPLPRCVCGHVEAHHQSASAASTDVWPGCKWYGCGCPAWIEGS